MRNFFKIRYILKFLRKNEIENLINQLNFLELSRPLKDDSDIFSNDSYFNRQVSERQKEIYAKIGEKLYKFHLQLTKE